MLALALWLELGPGRPVDTVVNKNDIYFALKEFVF